MKDFNNILDEQFTTFLTSLVPDRVKSCLSTENVIMSIKMFKLKFFISI